MLISESLRYFFSANGTPSHGMVVVRWADVCLISLRREILGGWGGVLMLVLWCRVDDVALVGDSELWRWFGPVPLLIPYFPKCPPIISRTPSDPIFPNVPSLTPTHLWFFAGAAVYLFSMGWVSLSSKEMPLTCSAGCSRQSAGCGWVHDPQGFPLSED